MMRHQIHSRNIRDIHSQILMYKFQWNVVLNYALELLGAHI